MPTHLHEKRLLIMLIYAFAMAFCVVGVLLFSIFNEQTFADLTIRFVVISLVPLILFYRIDCFYVRHTHSDSFIRDHLEWIAHNYILFLGLFLLNNRIIVPVLNYCDIGFNYFFLAFCLWIGFRFIKGLNLAITHKQAPRSRVTRFVASKFFHLIRGFSGSQKDGSKSSDQPPPQ